MVDGREFGIEVLTMALAARMTHLAVGGRWPHPFVSILHLAPCSHNGVECFRVLQPCCDINQDSRENNLVLWCSIGWCEEVVPQPPAEPYTRTFIHVEI